MDDNPIRELDITVSIAQTREDIDAGMAFCGHRYKRTYNTYWTVAPDILFVAKERDKTVGTGGLKFGY